MQPNVHHHVVWRLPRPIDMKLKMTISVQKGLDFESLQSMWLKFNQISSI